MEKDWIRLHLWAFERGELFLFSDHARIYSTIRSYCRFIYAQPYTSLKEVSGKVVANVQGNNIRLGSGSQAIANINGDNIRQGTSSTVIFNVNGDNIRQGS
jgi:hypothetical protein